MEYQPRAASQTIKSSLEPSVLAASPDFRVPRVTLGRVKRHDTTRQLWVLIHTTMADENFQRGDEAFEEEEEADDTVRGCF